MADDTPRMNVLAANATSTCHGLDGLEEDPDEAADENQNLCRATLALESAADGEKE
jgi:hypothetical protein